MIKKVAYIGCRVSIEFRNDFARIARDNETTPSKIMRKLIRNYMEAKE